MGRADVALVNARAAGCAIRVGDAAAGMTGGVAVMIVIFFLNIACCRNGASSLCALEKRLLGPGHRGVQE